ncbi:hypothetical protein QWZ13_03895 [Reinekea marina]|uniref:hypothetical protein n=1 Tax=Reinekea marina TaxID=1310421 RepID=UPI0025B36184|nr:hypothetical protein [Reinekea marina]MDN3648044.1 hypothetical protein [Reinekea marina]
MQRVEFNLYGLEKTIQYQKQARLEPKEHPMMFTWRALKVGQDIELVYSYFSTEPVFVRNN